jgi:hypothetical protein
MKRSRTRQVRSINSTPQPGAQGGASYDYREVEEGGRQDDFGVSLWRTGPRFNMLQALPGELLNCCLVKDVIRTYS